MTNRTSDDYRQEAAFPNQLGPWKPIALRMLYNDSLNMIAACKRNKDYCDIVLSWIQESAQHAETQHEIEIYGLTFTAIEKIKEGFVQ